MGLRHPFLSVALSFAWIAVAAADPPAVDEAQLRALRQLRELTVAMMNHHDAYKSFPPPAILSRTGEPLLSWRVKVLPFFGEQGAALYKEFKLDEPWDSPHNLALLVKMPDVYRCPKSRLNENGCTVYQVPVGPDTVFEGSQGTSIRQISDGTSRTICIVEVDEAHAVPWTKPADLEWDPAHPAAGLGGHYAAGFLATSCDCALHVIPLDTDPDVLRALFTKAGREPVKFLDFITLEKEE